MRLHILPDEKIINRTIEYFESVWPGQNIFIVLLSKSCKQCKYVNPNLVERVYVQHYNTEEFWNTVGDISQYGSIIIHYLTYEAARFINRIEHNNIYWIEWGGDLYNSFLQRKGFKIYSDPKLLFKIRHKYYPYKLLTWIQKLRLELQFRERYKSVFKIKYFVPDSMYGEYPLFLHYYPEFRHLQYKEFFYYPIQEIVGADNIDRRSNGQNIFLGNSASESNNHIDVFNILKDIPNVHAVYVPLSYGGPQDYTSYVINQGISKLGAVFKPITSFMPLLDYNTLLYNASFFIYANYRQEAVGNILFAFYIGGKVFLRKSNPLYEFYQNLGLVLFSLEDINEGSLTTPLSDEDYYNNKRIIEETYSNDRLKLLINLSFPNE